MKISCDVKTGIISVDGTPEEIASMPSEVINKVTDRFMRLYGKIRDSVSKLKKGG